MLRTINDSFNNCYLYLESEEDLNICLCDDHYQCSGKIIDKQDLVGLYPMYFFSYYNSTHWNKITKNIFFSSIQEEIEDMDDDILRL